MPVADKLAKLRTLAERGATEGERAAARAAIERVEARMQSEAPPRPTGFHDLMAGIGYDHASKEYVAWDPASEEWTRILTDEEIDRIVNQAFSDAGMHQSSAAHHHGRIWFDGS